MLVLKRQSDAERDGDEILALIRGSAVNQDGRSQGLTAPNGPSQQRVIRAALSASGLSADDIDVVEAHGTGTSLGDPIEAGALAAVFGPTRREERPLWLGSSKSNLGHTQAAAGVLGVMKMVLSLQHEVLPKTLHAEHPSEQIEWEGSGLSLLQEARAWPRDASRVRRAGVSSFGISGTNAHVVLEEAPARAEGSDREAPGAAVAEAAAARHSIPLLVSGRDEAALRAQAGRYADWLSRISGCRLVGRGGDGGVASDALCVTGLGVGAGCVGGCRQRCARWARAARMRAVSLGRRASGVGSWCSCSPGRAAQWLGDGPGAAG